MLNLFKKKSKDGLQDNSIQDMAQELTTNAIYGGTAGVNIAINNMLFREIYNWAKRHKDNGENITREVLLDKVNKQFFGNKFTKSYSNILGYNEKTVSELVDNVIANI